MTALRIILARLLGLFGNGARRDRELRAEIDAHIEEAAAEFVRQGMAPAEARRVALARFGGVTQTIEAHRERRRFRPFGSFARDLAYGARMLVRSPAFTLVAVLTLTIGILATTTTVSAVNAVLFRPLAIEKPTEVLQIFNGAGRELDDNGVAWTGKHSYRVYKSLREAATMFDGLLATWLVSQAVNVAPSATSRASFAGRRRGEVVSGNYFSLLGLRASQGRLFTEDDDRTPNAHPVAVIGETFWRSQLGADPDIVGRLVTINGHPFNVIGVAPASFTGTVFATQTDFWVPLMMQGMMQGQFGAGPGPQWHTGAKTNYVMSCQRADGGRSMIGTIRPTGEVPKFKVPPGATNCGPVRELGYLRIFGRLPGNVSRTAAESQLNAIAGHLAEPMYGNEPRRFMLEPEVEARHKDYSSQVRLISLLALGASILVWLVACGNVANLLLTRANARKRELAIRLSLGAGRWRIARQLLTESGLVAIVAGGIAIALTFWTSQALSRAIPAGQIPGINLDFSPDLQVLGWSLGLSVLTGLVFGTAPAWQSARINLLPALKPGDSGSVSGAHRLSLRNALVVGQLSLSVVVLIAAGLFVRSLQTARESLGPGFSTERLVSMRFDMKSLGYDGARVDTFYRDLVTRARSIPRVEAASIVNAPPFGEAAGNESAWLSEEGSPETRESGREVDTVIAGPRYFRTMGMPLVAGREFEDSDHSTSVAVAIINRAEARRLFGDEQRAVGKRVVLTRESRTELLQVVGITPDRAGDEKPPRILTVPAWQRGSESTMTLVLRAASVSDVRAVADAARTIAQQLDPQAPLFDLRLVGDHDDPRLGAMRLTAQISSALGLAALAMAMLGLYGVMAYAVTLRTREIGIRMALGAPATGVRALVMRQGLALTGIGLAMGFIAAYWLAPVVDRLLIDMPATDPVTFAGTALVLTTTTLVACYLPARRATRIDPIVTLRCE